MVLMAATKGIVLSEDDQRLIDLAADNYYGKLTAAEKTYTGATLDDVKDAFSDYFLANRLFTALTKEAQREISDDEARVISVQVIFLEKENTSLIQELYQKTTRDKEDFLTLAETYSKHSWIEGKVYRGELPEEVDAAAFMLTTGEISKVINCDEGLYLIKCMNNYEKELTAKHREELIETWKREMFKTEYDRYVQNLYMRVNENIWESIDLSYTAPKGNTSFYACYDEFLEGSE
jgi:foldase protein PrsA